jgi:uroporphyrinogen decarboxylase
LTGAGVRALAAEAERSGRLEELLAALHGTTTACRGPKPAAAPAKLGVRVCIRANEPHTSSALLRALAELDLRGEGVALVHDGERNDAFAAELIERGARLFEHWLYEWLLPEETNELVSLSAT